MNRSIFFSFLFSGIFLFSFGADRSYGQQVLLHETVKDSAEEDPFGPGRRHYLHPMIGFGMGFGPPESEGASIRFWGSGSFHAGLRYKLKILKRWETGVSLRYSTRTFRIEQTGSKKVFGNAQHEKEKLILNDLGADYYQRFVFGKRGDFIGTFLDLGVYGNYSLGKKHLTVDEVESPSSAGFEDAKTKRKGLTYVKDINYGALLRFGYNRWVLFGRYRLSDLFKAGGFAEGYPELPRFRAGIQIGLHR